MKPNRLAKLCLQFARFELLSLGALGLGALGLFAMASAPANSNGVCIRADDGEECATPIRIRPTFSEEGERGFAERSFADSFLGEALNGVADPLGGGSVGGDNFGLDATVDDLDADDRGLTFDAPFDPTNVIIPLDSVTK